MDNKNLKKLEAEKNKVIKANHRIHKLEKEYSNLKTALGILKTENKELLTENKEYQEIIKEKDQKISKYKEKIKHQPKEEKRNDNNINNKKLENAVISILIEKNRTIDELKTDLLNLDINITDEELLETLTSLKTKVNIKPDFLRDLKPTYEVKSINLYEEENIKLNTKNNKVDLILVSDIKKDKVSNLSFFDSIYEYATENGINLIINLGNQFNFKDDIELANIVINGKNNVEDSIKNIPYDKNIVQAILGGNLDSKYLNFGLDPIKYLSDFRSDIISLGYKESNIKINNSTFSLMNVDAETELLKKVKDYLRLKKINSEFNLVSNYGKSSLDLENKLLTAGSIFDDENKSSWHLKIFFDSKNNVENIIFIPIVSINKKMQKSSEIVYKKR